MGLIIMSAPKGFTLVEMLIVVLILAILGALALPKFSTASATARASMMADDLRVFRTQIEVFKAQHRSVPPGYPNGDPTQMPTEAAFVAHMTQSSNSQGQTAPPGTPGFPYGRYFREIPDNPVNGKASVQVLADGAAVPNVADDSHGWIYQPATMTFKADCIGADDSGKNYIDY